MNEDTAILRLLLDHGADVNVVDGYGETLLISAAGEGAAEEVRCLLSKKPIFIDATGGKNRPDASAYQRLHEHRPPSQSRWSHKVIPLSHNP